MQYSLIGYIFLLPLSCAIEFKCRHVGIDPDLAVVRDAAVPGRYAVRWCTGLKNLTGTYLKKWSIKVAYDTRKNSHCISTNPFAQTHSVLDIDNFDDNQLNCSSVCLSTHLDVVITGCYTFMNTLDFWIVQNKVKSQEFGNNVTFIISDFNENILKSNKSTIITPTSNGKNVTLDWSSLDVPITAQFTVKLCNWTPGEDRAEAWRDVSAQCGHGRAINELSCHLAELPYGSYRAVLGLFEPWSSGTVVPETFSHITGHFDHLPPRNSSSDKKLDLTETNARFSRLWWSVALAVVACSLAVSAAWLCARRRRRRRQADKLRFIQTNVENRNLVTRQDSLTEDAVSHDILLLYARDCAPFMRAMETLRGLLQGTTSGKVLDLYSPGCVRAMAPSPAEWVRALVQRDDVRVVFVQSRAAVLYAQLADDKVTPPLVPARAQYRSPQPGDALLHLALSLVRQSAFSAQQYTKYYIACLSQMPDDILPQVTRFRRYMLPEHTEQLLLALSRSHPATPSQQVAPSHSHLSEQLALSIAELVAYAAEHPNYLADLLQV